jgi:predicted Zn-dependent protease
MTDLQEGDFLLGTGMAKRAMALYRRVMDRWPGNLWGFLKAAEVLAATAPAKAIPLFQKATQLAPAYHGAWLRIAQLAHQAGRIALSQEAAAKALALHPQDRATVAFHRLLKNASDR